MKQLSLMIIFLFALAILTHAQNERKFVRQGNKYYGAALKDTTKIDSTLFNKAEIEYRKALDKKPTDPKWNFNLSNSLYKQMKFEESAEKFKEISELATDKVEKSHALHNMGNSLLMNNKLDESIEAYKQALRNNPKDLETKYNLLYAMNLKKKQEEEQKKQDKNKDQDKDKDKDKDQNKDQ
ncbi:MAG: tetratricopeptide repeat protein, partial [Bacteroidota bacterium]|nr:tetratricopeptide repeat protein [Bacteroidota bacterium]